MRLELNQKAKLKAIAEMLKDAAADIEMILED